MGAGQLKPSEKSTLLTIDTRPATRCHGAWIYSCPDVFHDSGAEMIKSLLHALVSRPVVYSLCQRTIGAGQVTQRIAEYVPSGYSRALDIGSGRGYAGRM